ncbi:neutral/alkaline non-lysosomal ceramidase N-terminal domain-containing protein [Sphingomonas sp. AOB5]|uniref:neutral/alkaline non-lysosomal ceramidase N-terminal domain-containing protein n=1 Tax=Sphingomonas sp. AOB5 TaxID=3034017 RepID=UPI0023F887A0|nr:neutral/alkaline non-lysosomal ceramidase N-terminal domain-containing protein [Sphingomonas sp. AOB5]MDF7775313.1 neutral/alkaline non-lysosomal ceramidase N-terminal domain-containing protein [Sphingomonas sp. AOB5]
MMIKRTLGLLMLAFGTLALTVSTAPPAPVSGLKVGAARVEITPPLDELPAPFTSVADPIYLRAVVVESGGRRAVIVIADVPTISAPVSADLIGRIAAEAKVPREQIVLGTTHTHNAIRVDPNTRGIILPGSPKFVEQVTAAMVKAVREAVAKLQPARAGIAKGSAHLIGNRNIWSPTHGRYISDVDRTGTEPVDSTLGVVKFESLDGQPIAFLLNYAIEPVIAMAIKSEISGDVPGAAARIIEERSGGAPALFTIGAAGVPLYRADDTPEPDRRAHALRLIQAYGQILAEEALATAGTMRTSADAVTIGGRAMPLICPGKATTPFNLPDRCAYSPDSKLPACNFVERDADPVKLERGVLRIGDLAIVHTDANVTPALGARLQRMTPVANTWIVALTFGPVRFVVDDAAYAHNTYEATATTAKKGCAETGYLDGSLEMITALR